MEIQEKSFDCWTDYDRWLVENYAGISVVSLNEENSKVVVKYADKTEFNKWLQEEKDKQAAADQNKKRLQA